MHAPCSLRAPSIAAFDGGAGAVPDNGIAVERREAQGSARSSCVLHQTHRPPAAHGQPKETSHGSPGASRRSTPLIGEMEKGKQTHPASLITGAILHAPTDCNL